MNSSCYVSELFYYPVKSLKGICLEKAEIDDFGMRNDRRFMLIDDKNKFVTQRTHPQLSQLNVGLTHSATDVLDSISIYGHSIARLNFNMDQFTGSEASMSKVTVWSDSVEACILENNETQCLSEFLGLNVKLAYMPSTSFRQIDRQYCSEDKRVSFADGYPFLLTSEASLRDLNTSLKQAVAMTNFRPNIVISGDVSAYAEDLWKRIVIGNITFELVKPCSRCVMTTIDSNGLKSEDKEPLITLSKSRKNDFGICFGQNLLHLSTGEIQKGDLVTFE
tara:strand:+ start:10430 stop:11263 length:834 start_codon:yes stop_codon:yes gene_type:complete